MIDNPYLWMKALHIIGVISWMAGMLYLPRLYVYHAGVAPGSEASEMLKVMERRLLRFIINPAMIVTWGFGIWLAVMTDAMHAGWFHGKLTLLFGMQIVHAMLARARKQFARDERPHSAKYYRILNEVPTALLVIIVFLVVLKPF